MYSRLFYLFLLSFVFIFILLYFWGFSEPILSSIDSNLNGVDDFEFVISLKDACYIYLENIFIELKDGFLHMDYKYYTEYSSILEDYFVTYSTMKDHLFMLNLKYEKGEVSLEELQEEYESVFMFLQELSSFLMETKNICMEEMKNSKELG